MSKPKRPDECHSFSIHVACIVGDRKAILLKEIYGWCHKNLSNNRNVYFGLAWTYNSAKAYKEKFPYWPEKSIARWLKELQNDGWIYATDKFNKFTMDRTRWYTIHFERYDAAVNSRFLPKSQNEIWLSRIDICISQNEKSISQNGTSTYLKMRNDISQNETTIPSSTISYSSTTTSKGDFAEKSAPLPNGSEKKEPQLKAKTKPKRKKVAAKKEIAKTEPKELSLHSKAKARFEHWQQIHNKEAPPVYWDGKEVGQLTQMINRLQDAARKKGYSWKNDDDFINRFFDVFCKKFIESGQWYADCFVPSAIVSQWNRIMQTLHDNGKKTNRSQNTGVTDSFRAKIIETLSRT